MGLTQERINEIALECAEEVRGSAGKPYYAINPAGVIEFVDLFLSRIREEQKIRKGYECVYCGMVYVDHKVTACDCLPQGKEQDFYEVVITTTPPAAPDCNGLVEALEKITELNSWEAIHTIVYQALAKHKSSMGEK